jgi:aspartate racemase
MKVGVLGGLGPKATADFMDLVIDNTDVTCDQEHVDMIVSNHATIPDRTAYILDNTKDNPVPYLINDAKMLESCGCNFLVMPCNTSHFMYDEISKSINIPIINMPYEVSKIVNNNPRVHRVGIIATLGTPNSKVYERYLEKEIYYPDDSVNNEVMDLIYNKVKKGISVSKKEFYDVANKYFLAGCDLIITGCTELSVIVRDNDLYEDNRIIDSLKVLADKTIVDAGKKLK